MGVMASDWEGVRKKTKRDNRLEYVLRYARELQEEGHTFKG